MHPKLFITYGNEIDMITTTALFYKKFRKTILLQDF